MFGEIRKQGNSESFYMPRRVTAYPTIFVGLQVIVKSIEESSITIWMLLFIIRLLMWSGNTTNSDPGGLGPRRKDEVGGIMGDRNSGEGDNNL